MAIATLNKIKSYPGYAKALKWGQLITITGSAQAVVQIAGLLCGILVVRLLPTQEYAFYTIANTMLGTMTILADGGISNSVLSLGGKVWQDKKQLGDVVSTGLYMRKRFAIVSLLIAMPILFYLLIHNGASLLTTLLISLSVIPAFISALSDTVLSITPKLHQDIKPLQRNQLQVSIWRLLLSCAVLFIFPFASLAVLCNGIPRAYGNIRLRKISNKFIAGGNYNEEIQKEITKTVKRVMPNAIFYCLTGQITIWIISFFGNSTSIAEIGALGRITALMTLFNTVFGILIIPRYARLNNQKTLLVKSYFAILFITLSLLGIACTIVYFFSPLFLSVLGNNYVGLNAELFLYFVTTCVGLISGLHTALAASRGWFIKPLVNIPIEIIAIVFGIFIFNISTLSGVIFYNLFLYGIYLLQYICYFIYCLYVKTSTVQEVA
ncbi:hypothetical protein GCM10027299_41670 [Larkinella ripae]